MTAERDKERRFLTAGAIASFVPQSRDYGALGEIALP
jgi:hypothetical protein